MHFEFEERGSSAWTILFLMRKLLVQAYASFRDLSFRQTEFNSSPSDTQHRKLRSLPPTTLHPCYHRHCRPQQSTSIATTMVTTRMQLPLRSASPPVTTACHQVLGGSEPSLGGPKRPICRPAGARRFRLGGTGRPWEAAWPLAWTV